MYREYLGSGESQIALTGGTILDHFREPPRRLKEKLVEESFRLKWAVSYQDFLNGKLNSLTEAQLMQIGLDINNIVFPDGTQMLIGSLETGTPLLFTVDPNGQVFEEENFAVVGSGYSIARAALCHREYHQHFPLDAALYAVFEAKRLSQGDPQVGPETAMWIDYLDENSKRVLHPLSPNDQTFLESQFAVFGPRPLVSPGVPPDVKKVGIRGVAETTSAAAIRAPSHND